MDQSVLSGSWWRSPIVADYEVGGPGSPITPTTADVSGLFPQRSVLDTVIPEYRHSGIMHLGNVSSLDCSSLHKNVAAHVVDYYMVMPFALQESP